MLSLIHRVRALATVAVLGTAACVPLRQRSETRIPRDSLLATNERIAHVLSRLTFGPRPGDAERVAAMGVDRWIDQQLHPESIADTAVVAALVPITAWSSPTSQVAALTAPPRPYASMPMSMLMTDTAARSALLQLGRRLSVPVGDLFYAGKIVRAQTSECQLLEVVADFWENHFSVFSGKVPSTEALITFDREALRPNALGKFRDLLGAVAHSPAMLYYLDNYLSTSRGLNENYARELLELHTLGVDGGYTQKDVQEVARALTGWTYSGAANPTRFVFRRELHDAGTKQVLGHTLAAGRGMEDGEEVLDILARHPSTARFISLKLARRLVSDDPPPALVTRAAATFTRTDGDIAAVVRTIVTSPEFFARASFRAKVKTPFELVVSARRALEAGADSTPATARLIGQLGQPTFGQVTPDGWPDRGAAWMNSGTLYARLRFASSFADGRVAAAPVARWHDGPRLASLALDRQIDGIVKDVLGGVAEPATLDAMRSVAIEPSGDAARDGQRRLQELLVIALQSPEFQRR